MESELQNIKKCLMCDEEFEGRVDKKFCSDYCRNSYHNKQNSDASKYMRNVNNILRKNRRILALLNPEEKAKVHRNKFNEKGFNFLFFTNIYKTKTGKTYYFCYDQGYLELENDYFMIVRKKEYVE